MPEYTRKSLSWGNVTSTAEGIAFTVPPLGTFTPVPPNAYLVIFADGSSELRAPRDES